MDPTGKWAAIVGIVALAAVLASCTSTDPESESMMDLQTVKGIAMAMKDEAAALVPAQNVGDQSQFTTAHLMGCSAGGYTWPGLTTLTLIGEVNGEELIEAIASAWEQKPGVTVERKAVRGGTLRVDMIATQGDSYSAGVWDSGKTLKIDSFSPCFEMEDGLKPGMEY
ncbi:hypothetical protein [Cryobacterium aureum]|uniref:hypothetical protein n=1 Tax=Cryobacterium aureum TaxID=995037 RepID=UPI000CF36523|nr:hypothetical protein [Cryobacterium aureum]